MLLSSLQEAKIKDKKDAELEVHDVLHTAYLHPSIVLAPMDSDSDDDPDTIKNGTAPGPNPESTSPEVSKKKTDSPGESTNKGHRDSALGPPSPYSGSVGNSRRRSKRLSGSRSPSLHDAGSCVSSPGLSRASSNAVYHDGASSFASLPREDTAPGSAWSSPHRHGAHVDEADRRHLSSPEPLGHMEP